MKRKILIVDDDQEFFEATKTRLESTGFLAVGAKSGGDGIKMAKEESPDLILMDIKMPDKDGVDVALSLLEDGQTKKIPIIFLTNLGDEAMAELNRKWSKEIGAHDYFKKSAEYEKLVQRIRDILEN